MTLTRPARRGKIEHGSSGVNLDSKGAILVERWDAGEMGCGQLVFELRARVNRMKPGDRLEVIARDPGAPTDLPAWCRMTGHRLVSANHPAYVIERRTD